MSGSDKQRGDAPSEPADEGQEARRFRDLVRSVIDSSPDWIFVKDLEHRFLLVNHAFAHAQRLEPDDMVGRPDTEFFDAALCEGDPATGARGFHDDDRAAFGGQLIRNVHDPATLHDGSLHVFDTFKGPLRDARGEVYGVLAYSRDVTELRDAERGLRESEQRFRALFEQAAVGVALIETATGRFVRVNRKYTEIIGYSEEAMTALDFMAITHAEDLAEDLAAMERLKRGEVREFALEKRLIRAGGGVIWVALTVSAMWAPGAAPTLHIAVVQDISARKEAEARSQHARDELESTLAALPDLLFDIDDEGRVYDFRAPDPGQLLVPPAVFLGRTFAELLPREASQVIAEAIAEALATGRSAGRSYSLVIRGATRWFELSMARKRVAEGRPRFVAIARDITDRVVAESQRRSLEAQLRQSQKMEAVGTLAGGIAHDFNNLLTVIGLSVETARMELADGHAVHESLDAIELVAVRAKNLVRQILAFGRKQPASRSVVAANEAVLDATRLLRATLPAGIKLSVALDHASAPHVHADPTQLQQVLINLGTNAWQAIERGVGTIAFSVRRVVVDAERAALLTLAPGEYACFQVSDDGAGMTPSTLERIFEPFFTTKGAGKGSGLGLSVVHGIVQEHGGAIAVDSQPGRGTTFEVYLGAVAAAAVEPKVVPAAVVPGRGETIAYVDDEQALMRPMLRLIESMGYRAVGYASAREAIDGIRRAPRAVDLVLTDFSMPELSGIDLARELVALRPDLPIVLVSGFAPQPDEQLASVGIRHRLTKPFDAATLSPVLRALLG